jgi:ribosome biogenesis GTPase
MSSVLAPWGFDSTVAARLRPGSSCGRVTRVDRGECDVVTEGGRLRAASDSMRGQDELAPVTGDWVELVDDPGFGPAISRVLPRSTALTRRDPGERDVEQVLAANIDVVAIVHGLDRPLPPGRLERMMVLADDSGAEVIVVLTKADVIGPDDDTVETVTAVVEDVPVILTSTGDGRGFDQVRAVLGSGRTLALLGASGAGKSTLVNTLVGDEILAVGEVREKDAKGRHTTSARELILLPGDAGLVLDTPGIRALGLWDAEEALRRVFGDLDELATGCRFNDCRHESEPGCALAAAVEAGRLDHHRFARYKALIAELDAQRRREQERERRPQGRGRGARRSGRRGRGRR